MYVATKFAASSPNAEIMGSVLVGFLTNLRAEDIRPILKTYHLEEIDVNKWYPQQLILDFDKAVAEQKVNATDNLVAIGIKLIDSVPLNPETKTVEDAIRSLDVIARAVVRNVPTEEGFRIVESRPGYALVVANTPWPDDLVYGYLWATVRRYKPANANFTVKEVKNQQPDVNPGVAYDITWG